MSIRRDSTCFPVTIPKLYIDEGLSDGRTSIKFGIGYCSQTSPASYGAATIQVDSSGAKIAACRINGTDYTSSAVLSVYAK